MLYNLVKTDSKSWDQFYDHAVQANGRLPSLEEARWITERYGSLVEDD